MRAYRISASLKFYTPSDSAATEAAKLLAEKMGLQTRSCQYWVYVPLEGLMTPGTLTAVARWAIDNPMVTRVSYWTQRGPCGYWSPEAQLASEDMAQLAAGFNESDRTRTKPLPALLQDFISLASQANETEPSLNSALEAARVEARAQAAAVARWAIDNPNGVTRVSYWIQRGPCGDWSPEAQLASEDLAQLAAGINEPDRTRTTPLAALLQDFVSLASQANETESSLNSALEAARVEARAQAEVLRQAQAALAAQ
jgi:hypothetical protein